MSILVLTPYIQLNGKAREAIALYEKALDAKVEAMLPMAEVPGLEGEPGARGRVVHARMRVGVHPLMLSDAMPSRAAPSGSQVSVCLDFDDPEEMARRFDALSEGGKVTMPIHDTFYGGRLGVLVDAVGVHWTMNWTKAPA